MQNIGEPVLQVWKSSKLILNGVELMRVETQDSKDNMYYAGRKMAAALGTQMHISNMIEAV